MFGNSNVTYIGNSKIQKKNLLHLQSICESTLR